MAGTSPAMTRHAKSRLERFPAKWTPVRVKKTRQNKELEPRSDLIGTEKALAWRNLRPMPAGMVLFDGRKARSVPECTARRCGGAWLGAAQDPTKGCRTCRMLPHGP